MKDFPPLMPPFRFALSQKAGKVGSNVPTYSAAPGRGQDGCCRLSTLHTYVMQALCSVAGAFSLIIVRRF